MTYARLQCHRHLKIRMLYTVTITHRTASLSNAIPGLFVETLRSVPAQILRMGEISRTTRGTPASGRFRWCGGGPPRGLRDSAWYARRRCGRRQLVHRGRLFHEPALERGLVCEELGERSESFRNRARPQIRERWLALTEINGNGLWIRGLV